MKKIQKNCALYTKSTKKRNNVLTCIVRIDIINLTNKTAAHLGCYCKAGKTKFYESAGRLNDRIWFFAVQNVNNQEKSMRNENCVSKR